jgi:hypothetical protein
LFCVTRALVWALAGFLTVVVYHSPDGALAENSHDPYRRSLLMRIVPGSRIAGLILGRLVLWDLTKLAAKHKPGAVFGIDLLRISLVAIGLGRSDRPVSVVPRSATCLRSGPTSVCLAHHDLLGRRLGGTVVSMRVIPKIMRLIEQA